MPVIELADALDAPPPRYHFGETVRVWFMATWNGTENVKHWGQHIITGMAYGQQYGWQYQLDEQRWYFERDITRVTGESA